MYVNGPVVQLPRLLDSRSESTSSAHRMQPRRPVLSSPQSPFCLPAFGLPQCSLHSREDAKIVSAIKQNTGDEGKVHVDGLLLLHFSSSL